MRGRPLSFFIAALGRSQKGDSVEASCPSCFNVVSSAQGGVQPCPFCGAEVVFAASSAEPVAVEINAWERRDTLGWVRAYFSQWKDSVLRPRAFWQSVQPQGPWQDALIYGWITWTLAALFSAAVMLFPFGGASKWSTIGDVLGPLRGGEGQMPFSPAVLGGSTLVGWVLFYPLYALLQTVLVHGGCLVFGCANNGLAATFRALQYGTSGYLFNAIPCLNIFGNLWVVISSGMGVQRLQETTPGRATGALLVPGLVICCLCGVALAGVFVAVGGVEGLMK